MGKKVSTWRTNIFSYLDITFVFLYDILSLIVRHPRFAALSVFFYQLGRKIIQICNDILQFFVPLAILVLTLRFFIIIIVIVYFGLQVLL